jgi:hypothetical protein
MARLIVEAIISNTSVTPNTAGPVFLTVSVTKTNGTPVKGLVQSDFVIGDTFASQRVNVSLFLGTNGLQIGPGAINADGLYMIELVPSVGQWRPLGDYHVAVIVKHGNDHGQTIAPLSFGP